MFLQDFIRGHYIAPWLDPRSVTGPIQIDDHKKHDVLASFCRIRVTFPDREATGFDLNLQNVPWDELVEEVASDLGGEWSEIHTGRCLTVGLTARSDRQIRRLAEAIRKVTGRGKRYDDCNWKWITVRVSDSLKKFAGLLVDYRRQFPLMPRRTVR
jgi:hypothetical protein